MKGLVIVRSKCNGQLMLLTKDPSKYWLVIPLKNEERVVNAFETWCWRRMLKIKWTHRITNDEIFRRAKDDYF